jgi:hypothetical protein
MDYGDGGSIGERLAKLCESEGERSVTSVGLEEAVY